MHLLWLFQSKFILNYLKRKEEFLFRSLGLLNCIRIWHDNTGKSSSSWFLKYLIIRDLQTMENFHFISQRWLAVEKEDGKVNNIFSILLIFYLILK